VYSQTSINYLAYGENQTRPGTSIHAERSALLNLPWRPRNSRVLKVSLLVIRTTHTGTLGQSKPCTNCIRAMRTEALSLGYYVSSVYYSADGGDITHTKLNDLDTTHESAFFRYRRRCHGTKE
jgi:hypothetical protein